MGEWVLISIAQKGKLQSTAVSYTFQNNWRKSWKVPNTKIILLEEVEMLITGFDHQTFNPCKCPLICKNEFLDVVYMLYPSIGEPGQGGLWIWGQPGLHSKFKASLSSRVSPCLLFIFILKKKWVKIEADDVARWYRTLHREGSMSVWFQEDHHERLGCTEFSATLWMFDSFFP
jgi:hypothetical protein